MRTQLHSRYQGSRQQGIAHPSGTFSVEWERQKTFYVEITLGTATRFYPLGNSKFKIYLPNSLDGDTSIRYDGEGNVRIMVPDPGEVGFPAVVE